MAYRLPELGYEFNALEPHIDARTMEIHYSKHHNAYVTNVNNAIAGKPKLEEKCPGELICDLKSVPEDIRTAVRNNGGGHVNHSLFWKMIAPGGARPRAGGRAPPIAASFGSFAALKEASAKAAPPRFGSGWAW